MNVQAALRVPVTSTAVAVIVFVPIGKFCIPCVDVVDGKVPKLTAPPAVGFVEVYVMVTMLVKPVRVGLS